MKLFDFFAMSETSATKPPATLGGMIEVYLKLKKSIEEVANHKLLLGEAYLPTTKMDGESLSEEQEYSARELRTNKTPLLEQLHQDWKLLPLHTNFITRTEIDAFDFIHYLGKPLPKVQDQLLKLCKESGYGDLRTGTTKFDKSVRHAYEITDPVFSALNEQGRKMETIKSTDSDPEAKISFTDDGDLFLEECLWNISDKLFLGKPIRAVFNKINVYTVGGKFEEHSDTPRKDSIGSLVIQLDNHFVGGDFVIRPDLPPAYSPASTSSSTSSVEPSTVADGTTVTTSTTAVTVPVRIGHKENKIQAYGFYSESPHQVEEVKSGTRVTITFWLMASNIPLDEQENWILESKNSQWKPRVSSKCRVRKSCEKKIEESQTLTLKSTDELEILTKYEANNSLDQDDDDDDDDDEIVALSVCAEIADSECLPELPVQFPQGKNDGHNFLIHQLCDTIFKCKKPIGFILTHRYSNDEHLSGNYKGNDARFIQILSARILQLNATQHLVKATTTIVDAEKGETKSSSSSSNSSAAEWKLVHLPVVVHHHEESWEEDSRSNKMTAKVYRFTYEDISELAEAVPSNKRHQVWENSPEYLQYSRECEAKKKLDKDYYSYQDHAKSQNKYWNSRMVGANNNNNNGDKSSTATSLTTPVATFFGSNYWQALKTEHQSGGLTGNEAMPDMQSNHYFTNAVIVYPPKVIKSIKSSNSINSKKRKLSISSESEKL